MYFSKSIKHEPDVAEATFSILLVGCKRVPIAQDGWPSEQGVILTWV